MENPINYWYQKYISLKAEMDKMLKDAVEGLFQNTPFPTIYLDDCKNYDFKEGDKVRIIVLPKED